jgi:hypothetical protein
MKQEATYDFLKDEVHCLYEEKKELQERIDKSLEYIEKYSSKPKTDVIGIPMPLVFNGDIEELLDILKGDNKNG